ncbi:hypothetical protein LTR04_000404 [Oleoguttula sp. CCFEE 6159]|nr:hypothetical protein LTR04_000404 [Oleoguttula sp. CCFEE 6159]
MANDSFLITNVRIFTGEEFIERGYVHVQDGKIAAFGAGEASSSPNTPVLNRPEHTLLPGFIDAHIHADGGNTASIEQSLSFGVTTVCDMHNEHVNVKKLQKLAAADSSKDTYADFKSCGLAATIDGGWPEPVVTAHDKSEETRAAIKTWPKLSQPSDAAPFVEEQVAVGASYIKLMHESGSGLSHNFPLPSLELQSALVEAAHGHHLLAVAHALTLKGTIEVLRCGVDGLTHTFFDAPPTDELVALYKRNNAHCNPKLGAVGSLTTEGQALQQQYADDPLAKRLLLSPRARENLCACMAMGKAGGNVANAYDSVRRLHAAGVPIVVGSDAAGPALGTAYGLSLHMEMRLLVRETGMRPLDVLKGATSLTAARFGFEDRGVIETGRKADLVLVEGDVEEFLQGKVGTGLVLPVKGVWRDGVVAKVWKDVMES